MPDFDELRDAITEFRDQRLDAETTKGIVLIQVIETDDRQAIDIVAMGLAGLELLGCLDQALHLVRMQGNKAKDDA